MLQCIGTFQHISVWQEVSIHNILKGLSEPEIVFKCTIFCAISVQWYNINEDLVMYRSLNKLLSWMADRGITWLTQMRPSLRSFNAIILSEGYFFGTESGLNLLMWILSNWHFSQNILLEVGKSTYKFWGQCSTAILRIAIVSSLSWSAWGVPT